MSHRPSNSALADQDLNNQVLVMRPKHQDPVWMRPYIRRLHEASRRAGRETAHLHGQVRLVAKNLLAAKYYREMENSP